MLLAASPNGSGFTSSPSAACFKEECLDLDISGKSIKFQTNFFPFELIWLIVDLFIFSTVCFKIELQTIKIKTFTKNM